MYPGGWLMLTSALAATVIAVTATEWLSLHVMLAWDKRVQCKV
jgi:hypothetical protein